MIQEKQGKQFIFTSESVTEGHPDKICDQISDRILEEALKIDKNSRVACECFAGKNYLLIGGEMTTKANLDLDNIARQVIKEIGYNKPEFGFSADTVEIDIKVNTQSPDIALGVDIGGAGDQGIMFGYACNETSELMPAPIKYAHDLAKKLTNVRKTAHMNELGPDGKTQVSVVYDENHKVIGIDTILISTQHSENLSLDDVRNIVIHEVIKDTIPSELITSETKILVNPTGRFVIGGPMGDTGLTGRKIIVDTYGGMGRHGGGAFSGKDPTKVDRSATYMARCLAKSVVACGYADRCEVQLSYAIGGNEPISIYVDTFGTGKITNNEIIDKIKVKVDLTPKGIIEKLDLLNIPYSKTAAYGHMGRVDIDAPWERIISL